MGCISSKDSSPIERPSRKGSLDRRVAHVNSSRRDDGVRSKERIDSKEARLALIDKKTNGSVDNQVSQRRLESQLERKKLQNFDHLSVSLPNIERNMLKKNDSSFVNQPSQSFLPNSIVAEQVAVGWPYWLASAAGEAIKGWTPRRANTFEKLDRIGQGTYSNVYRARDIMHNKIVAIKKVRFDNKDPESVKFMAREILILRSLDHPNIIKLEGLITSSNSSSLYLVFEYMEHDLTGLSSLPSVKFTESQIKCYMTQLLRGLDHCHSRNVLHRDIKGSNLLIDDNGTLKIADFGLASFYDPQSSAQLTSRVVTLWYRAPELLLGSSKYGVAVDLWSAGCILGELYTKKPILPGRTEVEQLHKIFKLCGSPSDDYWAKEKVPHSSMIKHQRPYRRSVAEVFRGCPSTAVSLLDMLLSLDPHSRGTAASALNNEYFTTKPLACDPSVLPKYPPSKEMDAKMREEDARRQSQQTSSGVLGSGSKDIGASREPEMNSSTSIQKNRPSNSSTLLEAPSSRNDLSTSRFIVDPYKQTQLVREGRREPVEQHKRNVSFSGPLVQGTGRPKSGKDPGDSQLVTGRTNYSTNSGLATTRTLYSEVNQEKPSVSMPEPPKLVGRSHAMLSSSKPPMSLHQLQRMSDSPVSRQSNSVNRDPTMHGRGPKGNKIYVSGPLLVSSSNVEHLVQEHDRQIQDLTRRNLRK